MSTPAQLPLAFTDPNPRRLVRRGDGGGSAAAAADLVDSGRDAQQVAWAIALVASLPGRTSAELAAETVDVGTRQGFHPRDWRYVLGRRLSEAEDRGRGPIVGVEHQASAKRPWRHADSSLAPCRQAGRVAIRWYPVAMLEAVAS